MSDRSLVGLNWLNFLVAVMQTGFGAFLTVFLSTHLWSQTDIGFALSVGTIAALVSQVPAGLMVDAAPSKPAAAAVAILAIVTAAMVIARLPETAPVLAAEAVQGAASCVLGPAIAAITLALAQRESLGERLGSNVRFAAIGSSIAAALMGWVGYTFSHRAVFYLAAGCGLASLVALWLIRTADLAEAAVRTDHPDVLHPRESKRQRHPRRDVFFNPCLLTFAACVGLFQLGNAAVLPLAANVVTRSGSHIVELVVAASIIVPQVLAAMFSPALGRAAQRLGRRPVLLVGFAAMPARALLFAIGGDPDLMVGIQALDAFSAAAFGVMIPLVVADITHRGGRFNLALGVVGLAVGVGASISTTLGLGIADRFGDRPAFLALAGVGLAATAAMWFFLPETRHMHVPHKAAPRPA